MASHELRIGCSGWNYDSWREIVYPRKGCPKIRWLERYAELFDTVEVNSTFYRLPKREPVAHWAEQTPEGFVFTIKMSRYITHIKRLADASEKGFSLKDGIARFYERIEPLIEAGKLGPVLWQLPPNLQRDDARLAHALELLPPGRHCFEFRHPSWFTAPVYRALEERDVALVVGDDPQRPFTKREMTASWTFVRFHRGSRGRRGNYSPAEIATWKRRIGAWRARRDVYAYFNNDWEAFAPRNALALAGREGELGR